MGKDSDRGLMSVRTVDLDYRALGVVSSGEEKVWLESQQEPVEKLV